MGQGRGGLDGQCVSFPLDRLSLKYDYPELAAVSPSTLAHFIRLASTLKDPIVDRQSPNWDPSIAPWSLPAHVQMLLVAPIAVSEVDVDGLWQALKGRNLQGVLGNEYSQCDRR